MANTSTVKIQYSVTDVTKYSLIGPRFRVEVFYPGCKNVCFFQSIDAAQDYIGKFFGFKGPKVELEQIPA